ncbi:structural maintenance of chromosomes protein 4 [Cimex lectularius]|uniref:Structural maintenance of chromosomes protein n=1 Tax=Cimex lectularius TaxID=79782 RepID=A0A8I6RZ59_CIMLE|nr:structural maintenance of chromosomes protein 4 [Cimex lectularius]
MEKRILKRKSVVKVPVSEKRQKAGNGETNPQPAESDTDSEYEEEEGGFRIGGVYVPPPPVALCSSETAGPRLIITHIVNMNFKSYAGRQVLGPFHKSFTSIIGPNGSGKSNVIDSMLFVFGYRASKIRSKKISVLIHKSENFQNIRSCSVEVHFHQIQDKDGDDFEVIPNSDIVIGRTANADNSSFYTVNGKKSHFKQVAAILRSHGIDLVHNRFLILQGEVEQIAMMKPKAQNEHDTGMLEYLEDIIGTRRYMKPLCKLEGKVGQLEEERQEKFNKCKMAENDCNALKPSYEEAKEYLKISNRYAYLSNKLFQKRIWEDENKLQTVQKQKEEVDKEIAEYTSKLEELEKEQNSKEEERISKQKHLEKKKLEKEKMCDEFNKTENSATKLKEEISETNKRRKRAVESKKSEENKLAELEKIPDKNAKEIEELRKVEAKLKKSQNEEEVAFSETLQSINEETRELQEQKDVLSNKLIGLNKSRDEAKAKYNLAKTELDVYENNEKKEKAKLENFTSTLQQRSATLEEKTRLLEKIKQKLPVAMNELKESQKELSTVKPEEIHTMEKLNSLRAQLQEKRSSLQANRSRNRVLEFIMKQKEKGVLPGVFGRLGDLGGIDAKYDCAVSTACGPLDYIVTDTVKTAKACVEQLKKYDVGRGNFIALDQQEGLKAQYQRGIKTPENVPRLFDLIKVNDERVKPAFYFGLRDTLVAKDLNQAKRCAYGATRYRVVTLSGEIIEIAGTMSGGGKQKSTGRMGRSATVATGVEGNSEEMESEIAQLQERSNALHSKMNQLEEKVASLTRDTRKWKIEQNNIEIEIKGLKQQVIELKQQVKEQEEVVKAAAPDPGETRRLKTNLDQLKKDFDKASEKSAKLEGEVAVYTKNIEDLTGGRIKEARGKLDKITTKLDKITKEITKLDVGIHTSKRNVVKCASHIENYINEIGEAEQKLLDASEKNKELIRIADLLNQKIEVLTNEIVEIENSVKQMDSGMGNYSSDINKFKASVINKKQKIDGFKKEIHDIKGCIASQKKQLTCLKLYEIPEEEDEEDDENLPLDQRGAHTKVLPTIPPEELEQIDQGHLEYIHVNTGQMLEKSDAKHNLEVIKDYREKHSFYKDRVAELDNTTKLRDEVRQGFEKLKQARLEEFMTGFEIISTKLKEMYQMITLGGDAEFELKDSLDPFTEGVIFSVRPPKKSWKEISNLSGGEKTLSSLALVFALHYYKPSPLYVMDEIDAALDFKNVSIVGNYIKDRTKNAQFIIISLRSNMFELADLLVGIYKTYNCTKSTTITPKKYEHIALSEAQDVPQSSNKNVATNVVSRGSPLSKATQQPHSTSIFFSDTESDDACLPPRKKSKEH